MLGLVLGDWSSLISRVKAGRAFPILETSAKSVQTTAEVSRKYYVLTNLSVRTHRNKYVYLRKCLPRTHWNEYVVLISVSASHLFWWYGLLRSGSEPQRGGTSCASIGCGRYVVLYLSVGAFVRSVVPLLRSSILLLVRVSPGFHIRLCPHSTLGFAGVSPLQGSLSYWAFAVLCRGIMFVKCVWVCKWIVAVVRVFVWLWLYCLRDWLLRSGNEPQRGDTPA